MGVWGFFVQGSDQQLEAEELGSILSIKLGCAVHYPAYNKPLYECSCGITFPVSIVRHCRKVMDWGYVLEKHGQPETITINKPKSIGPTTLTQDSLFWRGQAAMKKAAGDLD